MNQKNFGIFLSSQRKKKHLSQSYIAEKLGYSKQIVYNWEKGYSYPNLSCWGELMKILDLDINGFIYQKRINKIKDHKFDENRFIYNLKELRIKSGLTQIELAEKINTNHKTISSWENGSSLPSLDNFVDLAKVFNVNYPTLFYGEEISIDEKELALLKKRPLRKALIIASSILAVAIIAGATTTAILVSNSKKANSNDTKETSNIDATIKLSKERITLRMGETYKLEAQTDLDITWMSLDETVATVEDGLVTPVSYGTTSIIAYFTNNPTITASCFVSVKYQPSVPTSDIVPLSRDVLEFFYPSEKVTARFFFEDKKTNIYEKQYEVGDPFSYDFVEPVFGPYNGWEFSFVGWDINDDGEVDELPSTIEEDLNCVAVYEKTPTDKPNFVELRKDTVREGEWTLYKCTNPTSTLIFPSKQYKDSLTPSDMFAGDDSQDKNIIYTYSVVEKLIYMEGSVATTAMLSSYFPKVTYLSLPKSMRDLEGPFNQKITINGGYIRCSHIQTKAFKGGITNKMVNIDISGIDETYMYQNAFSGCSDLEYINIRYDSSCKELMTPIAGVFNGCTNLKYINIKDRPSTFKVTLKLGSFAETNVQYFDMSLFDLSQETSKIKTDLNDNYSILTKRVSDELINCFDSTCSYSVYVHDTSDFVDPSLLNTTFYLYSETKDGDSWHFNANGLPTFEY